ncbi:hypothetical protein GGR52DRAFT_90083 [Hypoxylon sp. FL1284]|nr:hypothetical protein GGR52DRAFT_90083 [Hypoxylon sp. FL1284]
MSHPPQVPWLWVRLCLWLDCWQHETPQTARLLGTAKLPRYPLRSIYPSLVIRPRAHRGLRCSRGLRGIMGGHGTAWDSEADETGEAEKGTG